MLKLPRLRDQPYLLLSLTSLFWAGNAIVGRAVAGDIPPVMLAQMRWTFAFLILLPFAWPRLRYELPVLRQNIGIVIVLSLTGITAFNTMLYWSLQYTTAINATLMQSSAPLLIGLVSWALFGDPLTRLQIAGVFLSLCGVATIVSGGEPARLFGLSLNVGDVAIVIAMAIYAIYATLLRKRPTVAPLSLVCEYVSGARFATLDLGDFAAIGYVSVFPSILSYVCFNRGVELIGANRAGPFFHLIPLFGVILAVLFLGERLALFHVVGAALIIGGVVIAGRRSSARA